MNLKKKFSMSFFLFILHYYLSFLDGSKKKHCTIYLHLTVIIHRLSTSTKKYKHKEKNKTKCEGPTNKSTKALNIFGIFCYRKGVRLVKYQIRKEGNLPRHAAAGGEVAGDWVKKKRVEGGRRLVQGSPPSSFFIYFIFLSFRVSGNGLLLGSLLLGFLSNRPLLLFFIP